LGGKRKEGFFRKPLFSLVPLSFIKVEQTMRKDARASQEACLMPPETSVFKM